MNRTAEEQKEEYQQIMGEELGLLFHTLSQELRSTYLYWQQFVELFGSGEKRVEILNRTAPRFFRMTQQLLWTEALLSVSRLLAPAKSRGKPNLTIRRFPDLVQPDDLSDAVERKIEKIVADADFAFDWRNRHIAHRDLLLALDKPTNPLAEATRAAVDKSLESIADVMNDIELSYMDSTTSYSNIISNYGARELLYYLRDGLRRAEDRNAALERGEYDERLFNDEVGPV